MTAHRADPTSGTGDDEGDPGERSSRGGRVSAALRRQYGGHPLQLIVLLASFALAGYAALTLFSRRTVEVAVWFVGAAVLHDVVLLPLYVTFDRVLSARPGRTRNAPPAPWLNYVRFPAVISGILLLVFLPSIARLAGARYPNTTDLSSSGYFARWLGITGVLFLLSAVAYTVRLVRSR